MALTDGPQVAPITVRVIPEMDPKKPEPPLTLADIQDAMHHWLLMSIPQYVNISALQKSNIGVCAGVRQNGECTSGRCYVVWTSAVPHRCKESRKVAEGVLGFDLGKEFGMCLLVVYFAGEGRCDVE
jgi:hypothetical protein